MIRDVFSISVDGQPRALATSLENAIASLHDLPRGFARVEFVAADETICLGRFTWDIDAVFRVTVRRSTDPAGST